MTEKDVDTLADSILELSESEKERSQIDSLKSLNLLKFIDAQVCKATQGNDLKSEVKRELERRLADGQDDQELTNVELIKLLEILNKDDTDYSSNIMNSITELYKIKQEEERSKANPAKSDNITKEDLQQIKDLSQIFKKLSASEFPELEEEESSIEESTTTP